MSSSCRIYWCFIEFGGAKVEAAPIANVLIVASEDGKGRVAQGLSRDCRILWASMFEKQEDRPTCQEIALAL